MFRSLSTHLRIVSRAGAAAVAAPSRQTLIRTAIPLRVGQRYNSSGPASSLCPSCSKRLPTQLPACPSCGYISPLSPDKTYHSLFDLPFEPNPFLIDTAKLKTEFRKAQAACHPDAWSSKGSDKYNIAQNLSSSVNEAYQGLLRPIKRVEYVLSLNGQALGEEDKVDDFMFIEEVIEIMEQLEELGPEAIEEVKAISSTNNDNTKDILEVIEGQVGAGNWAEAKKSAARLRYYDKIGLAVGRWAEQHDTIIE